MKNKTYAFLRFSSLGEEDQGHLSHHEHVQPGRDSEMSYCWVLVSS